MGGWWTGLDSNQRTETRADLQSAAFNHSATCPQVSVPLLCGQCGSMTKAARPVNGLASENLAIL